MASWKLHSAQMVRPSRRDFIRLGGGLVATAAVPALLACDGSTSNSILDINISVLSTTPSLTVQARLLVINDSSQALDVDVLVSLVHADTDEEADRLVLSDPRVFEPGEHTQDFELTADTAGPHYIAMLFNEQVYQTETFELSNGG